MGIRRRGQLLLRPAVEGPRPDLGRAFHPLLARAGNEADAVPLVLHLGEVAAVEPRRVRVLNEHGLVDEMRIYLRPEDLNDFVRPFDAVLIRDT